MAIKKNLAEIHAAVLLFGLAGLFGKWLFLSPILIVLGRVVFAGALLGALVLLGRGRRTSRIELRGDAPVFVLLGLLLALHWVAFFRAIQVSSVAVGLLSYSSFPLFTAFLEPLINRERWEARSFLLSLGCLAGVVLIVPRFNPGNAVFQGVCWGVLSGLAFSVLAVLNRRLTSRHPALHIAFFEDASAALFLLPFVFVLRPSLSGRDFLLLAVLGFVCTALAHTLFIRGMTGVSARTASIISSLEPAYGAALAFLFLGEAPAARTLAGGALIIGSSLLASRAEGRRPVSVSSRE